MAAGRDDALSTVEVREKVRHVGVRCVQHIRAGNIPARSLHRPAASGTTFRDRSDGCSRVQVEGEIRGALLGEIEQQCHHLERPNVVALSAHAREWRTVSLWPFMRGRKVALQQDDSRLGPPLCRAIQQNVRQHRLFRQRRSRLSLWRIPRR